MIRFVARPDSYTVKPDSFLPYTLDSVSLSVSVDYRDTTVKHLRLYLYRLPATVDSSVTFQGGGGVHPGQYHRQPLGRRHPDHRDSADHHPQGHDARTGC